MKRVGYLIDPIADMDNLRLAFWKAQRGKAGRPDVIVYRDRLDQNLLNLREQILAGRVEVGDYRYFKIFDPKERQICSAAFSERVLHHALINICHPYFERKQIFDSYASRRGKGTYAALDRAAQFARQYRWFLKLDCRKYFDSIDHAVAQRQLAALFKDPRLLAIFAQIIVTYQVEPGKGMPIGNLTSQYIANHYLSPADHFAKEVLKVPAYVRYMDDMVLFHDDRATLLNLGEQFGTYMAEALKLTLKPPCLNQTARGLPFLSYLVYPHEIRLARRSKVRFRHKLRLYLKNYRAGFWSAQLFARRVLPLVAFTEKARALGYRRSVLRAMGETD